MNILFPLILSLFSIPLSGILFPFECNHNLLNEGVEFDIENPKELEGTYKLTLVPTWDFEAEVSIVELTLIWEHRYKDLESNSFNSTYVENPLIGFINGEIQNSTAFNISDKLSVSDPFNPALRFIADTNSLRFPGGKVDPECEECISMDVDGTEFELQFKRNINGIYVGEWAEDFGILSIKNSEGKSINKDIGYFCAELKQ